MFPSEAQALKELAITIQGQQDVYNKKMHLIASYLWDEYNVYILFTICMTMLLSTLIGLCVCCIVVDKISAIHFATKKAWYHHVKFDENFELRKKWIKQNKVLNRYTPSSNDTTQVNVKESKISKNSEETRDEKTQSDSSTQQHENIQSTGAGTLKDLNTNKFNSDKIEAEIKQAVLKKKIYYRKFYESQGVDFDTMNKDQRREWANYFDDLCAYEDACKLGSKKTSKSSTAKI